MFSNNHPVAKPNRLRSKCGCYMSKTQKARKKRSVLLNKSHESKAIGRLHFPPFPPFTFPLKILPLCGNPFMLSSATETEWRTTRFEDGFKNMSLKDQTISLLTCPASQKGTKMVKMSNQNGRNWSRWHDNGSRSQSFIHMFPCSIWQEVEAASPNLQHVRSWQMGPQWGYKLTWMHSTPTRNICHLNSFHKNHLNFQ